MTSTIQPTSQEKNIGLNIVTTCTLDSESDEVEVTMSQCSISNSTSDDKNPKLFLRRSSRTKAPNRRKSRKSNLLPLPLRKVQTSAAESAICKQPRNENSLLPLTLRKAQSANASPSKLDSRSPSYSRSFSDFDACSSATISTSIGESSKSLQEQVDIKLISSSISDDVTEDEQYAMSRSKSENHLMRSSSRSDLSSYFYSMLSSWRNDSEFCDDSNFQGASSASVADASVENNSEFFSSEDFDTATWLEVNAPNGISILGAAVMTATVVIHPLVFVAGAVSAVWAVGALHAAEKGYQFFSDGSFSNLFWADSTSEKAQKDSNSLTEGKTAADKNKENELHIDTNNATNNATYTTTTTTTKSSTSSEILPSLDSPLNLKSPSNKRHISSSDIVVQKHFPALTHKIVEGVKFPGLNALEFFQVFLADDAPYSFQQFQQTRGDMNVDYGKWEKGNLGNNTTQSFHPDAVLAINEGFKFPSSSRKERELNFKTLTKSYFGPAYATARKVQRVTKFSTRLVIVESKTELFDIPFCDRFYVVDRWVIEADKKAPYESIGRDNDHQKEVPVVYTSKLSVSAKVFMLRSCSWEKQIQQKTLSTLNELLESWTKRATIALDMTMKKKQERLASIGDDDGTISLISYKSTDRFMKKTLDSPKEEKALLTHQKKLQILEEKFSAGDMDWCNIETRLSEKAGEHGVFAEVLNQNNESSIVQDFYSGPTEISIPISSFKAQKRGILRRLKKKLK